MPLRVLIADDHQMFRQGLRVLLEREQFEIAGEASDGHQALQFAKDAKADVAVLDFAMPLLNGLDAARQMQHVAPATRVVLLTMYSEDHYVLEALRAGVRGYVVKTQTAADLAQAIREVSRGAIYLSPGVSRAVVEAFLSKSDVPPDPLTPREREVLQLVAEGKTSKEIAALLGVSVKTAESHRSRMMQKLDIHDTASLVRYAIRRGLVRP